MNRAFARYRREFSVAAAYLVLLAALTVAPRRSGDPSFFRAQFADVLISSAPVLVAAIGMTLVILCRQIDISIGSQFAVCGIAAGLLAQTGLPMPVVAALTVALGAGFGAINGVLVAFAGLPSIIVTLATMVTLREGLRWAREGEYVRDLPPHFQWFGSLQARGEWIVIGVAVGVFLVAAWACRNLAAGRAAYATGSDPEAARLAGIRPHRVILGVFMLMGGLTGLAALLNAVRFAHVDPNMGTGLELKVIAAVVVGGTAVTGGRGTVLGTLIGVLLLGTIGPALVFLGAQPQWEKALQGVIILVAVAVDGLGRRRR